MKPFRSTAALFVLVLALAGYTLWEYKKAARDVGTSPQERKLFELTADKIDQLKLVRGGETVLVVRTKDGWQMKQPVEDIVENSAMDTLLYSLLVQKGKIFRSEDESKSPKWSEYGLDPAGSSVEITGAGKTETLAVSSKNAFDGSYYIRQGDDLMLGDHGLAQFVGRDPSALRSRHLWRGFDTTIESVDVQVHSDKIKDQFTLKRTGEKWSLEPSGKFPVDEAKIDHWVASIMSLTPTQIVSETLSESDKRADLLLMPSLIFKLNYKKADGSKGNWILTIGQDRAEDVFLTSTERSTVYKTTRASIEPLRVSRDFFRDGRAAFHFPVEQAVGVEVASGDFLHKFVKEGSNWKLSREEKDYELHPEKLADLLHAITSLDAQEFRPAKEAKGYKPTQRITVRDSGGQTIFEVSWGDEYEAKEPYNKGMTFRYVHTNLETEAMGVQATKITGLINHTMVSKKAEQPKADKK